MKNGRFENIDGYEYYLNDILHREDGPAMEKYGEQYWAINGHLHRIGGPAFIGKYSIQYYQDGNLHREDGPALILFSSGQNHNYWAYHGEHLDCKSQKEFEQLIKWKAFW